MHVPSTGLTRDERAIVREGYRLAERLLRDYDDAPASLVARIGDCLAKCRRAMRAVFRACVRN